MLPIASANYNALSINQIARLGSGSLVADPDFEYVVMLLAGNGANGAQNNTFRDGSANNFTVTRSGNATQGTFTPFGDNWSNYFDGTGDYLTVPDSTAFDLTGDFTLEMWVYPITRAGALFGLGDYRAGADGFSLYYSTNKLRLFVNNADVLSGASDITPNQWSHIALVRSGVGTNNLKLYINGTQDAQATVTTSFTGVAANGVVIDNDYGGSFGATTPQDYLSNVRLVKGTAVYTSAFTPPTSPLTAITNTQLLTSQSNRFIDNSTNAFTITLNGDVSVQRFSPFSPTAAYSSAVIGGSGYFGGTTDFLALANNAALQIGGGNWTIECWVNGGFQTDKIILSKGNSSASHEWLLYVNTSGNISFAYNQGSLFIFSSLPLNNSWQHIAVVNVGTTVTLYINGSSVGTTSGALTNGSNDLGIGSYSLGAADFTGYISSYRLVKGTAVYTANFTPPTTPPTAITNTQLLLNFTNAGIIDNAMMNDLETVGNAQISTAQSKFGGSSMYFDGSTDCLSIPKNPNLNLSTGDFTIEFWVYWNAYGSDKKYVLSVTDSTNYWQFRHDVTDGPGLYISSFVKILSQGSNAGWSTATWYHVALVRSGNNFTIYRDGTSVATGTSSSALGDFNTFCVGGSVGFPTTTIDGYIDDLRITKGVARYTANFTPPTAAFPLA